MSHLRSPKPSCHPFIPHVACHFPPPLLLIAIAMPDLLMRMMMPFIDHLLYAKYYVKYFTWLVLILRTTGSERWRKLPKAIDKEGAEPGLQPRSVSGTMAWALHHHTVLRSLLESTPQPTLFPVEAMAQRWQMPCFHVRRHYCLLLLCLGVGSEASAAKTTAFASFITQNCKQRFHIPSPAIMQAQCFITDCAIIRWNKAPVSQPQWAHELV